MSAPRTRREFLAGGAGVLLAGGLGALLAACTDETGPKTTSTTKAGTSTTAPGPAGMDAIEHVVFLMLENRSFDHYFGSYRGVRGFDDRHGSGLGPFAQPWSGSPAKYSGHVLPFHLDTAGHHAECTHDLSHTWQSQHRSWNRGAMDGFVTTHTSSSAEGPVDGVLTMGFYTRADLGFHYALADAFTICDGYHCSVMGPTHPNRLYSLSATLDPAGGAGGPILDTSGNPARKFSASWTSMPERLEAAGVSWKFYNPPGAAYAPDSPVSMLISDNIMLYFRRLKEEGPLRRKAFGSTFPRDFLDDIERGTLPQVSWVVPTLGFDEHPPTPPACGEWFTAQVLAALVARPDVWAKTVLFITFDENDGFFDHVAPPVAPPGTPGEYVTTTTLPASASGIAGPIGLGFRVPMLVVSPFSRGGYVCSETFDHTSQLRFLETRFGVEVPNLSAWRRGVTGDLTGTLRLSSADTSVPSLPPTFKEAPVVGRECTLVQRLELDIGTTPYPVPVPQQMPSQEPGAARRVG